MWMIRNDLSFAEMGRRLEVTANAVSKLCGQDTMPVTRHRQLVEQGVPVELLPAPMDIKPGPKPRSVHDEFQAAFRG